MKRHWLTQLGLEVLRQNEAHIPEALAPGRPDPQPPDAGDGAEDVCALIDAGLVAVTGRYPDLRYCLTPEGQRTLDDERSIADEARELAKRRHAASQDAEVIDLFPPGRGA
jgi:hypothetical protein